MKTCPRCNERPLRIIVDDVEVPGAISRRDNKTEICSDCGAEEAMFDLACSQAKDEDLRLITIAERLWLDSSTPGQTVRIDLPDEMRCL